MLLKLKLSLPLRSAFFNLQEIQIFKARKSHPIIFNKDIQAIVYPQRFDGFAQVLFAGQEFDVAAAHPRVFLVDFEVLFMDLIILFCEERYQVFHGERLVDYEYVGLDRIFIQLLDAREPSVDFEVDLFRVVFLEYFIGLFELQGKRSHRVDFQGFKAHIFSSRICF